MHNVFELLKIIYQITYANIYINKDGSSMMSSRKLHIFPRTSEHVCSSFPFSQINYEGHPIKNETFPIAQ